jgi:hypothetical protein
MANDIERYPPHAVYQRPLAQVTPALHFATQLQRSPSHFEFAHCGTPSHDARGVPYAIEQRNKFLPKFAQADDARGVLNVACRWAPPDRKTASAMIGALLGAFGARADKDVLVGMLDMIESDQMGIASELWQPMHLSPAKLALACRKLIVTNKFPPRAAELHEACCEADYKLAVAERTVDELVEHVRRHDAVLLAFARDEWERPYLTHQYRPVLDRMLELHAIWGIDSETWDQEDDDGNPLDPFQALVWAEQAKLALPEPPREAACEAKPVKRTRKPKGEDPDA